MPYLALIGDICGSRDLEDRGSVQNQLQQCLNDVNKRYADVLVSPLTITLGDEFQGLFKNANRIWEIVVFIESRLHPTGLRFGLGTGDISTEINTSAAIGMDGPAFYNAREAIQAAKKSENNYRIRGLGQDEELANQVLILISDNRNKWSANRIEILYSLLRGEKVDRIASGLGISKTAVYKNISDGSLKPIHRILQVLSEKMNQQLGV